MGGGLNIQVIYFDFLGSFITTFMNPNPIVSREIDSIIFSFFSLQTSALMARVMNL